MALKLLTDQQISPAVAEQISAKRPEVAILSLQAWHGGAFLGASDQTILRAALAEELTLVTYDRRTIAPLLVEWGISGTDHAGVVFLDDASIRPADTGGQVRALIVHWDETHDWDWKNRIVFLRRAG